MPEKEAWVKNFCKNHDKGVTHGCKFDQKILPDQSEAAIVEGKKKRLRVKIQLARTA